MIAAKIGNVIVIEAYSPVSSAPEPQREEFYSILTSFIRDVQREFPQTSITILGDFNAHITGFFSAKTDANGHLLRHLARTCGLCIEP